MVERNDWPDWLSSPVVKWADSYTFTGDHTLDPIVTIEAPQFAFATIMVVNESGQPADALMQFYDATISEGPNTLYSTAIVFPDQSKTLVPVELWSPSMRLLDNGGGMSPQDLFVAYAYQSVPLTGLGFPGGARVAYEGATVNAGATKVFDMAGCYPSKHRVLVKATAAAWTFGIRQWFSYSSYVDYTLATNATYTGQGVEFLPMTGGFNLWWINGDGVAKDVTIVCTRERN